MVRFGGSAVVIDHPKSQKWQTEYCTRHPNEPNTLPTRKGNEEAAIHDPPLSATSEYNRKSKKGESRKITRPPDKPTNRCTRTSDRSGPAYLPPHNLRLPPARSLQYFASEAPPPECSRAIRHSEAIFDPLFDRVNDQQYQCLCCSKNQRMPAGGW